LYSPTRLRRPRRPPGGRARPLASPSRRLGPAPGGVLRAAELRHVAVQVESKAKPLMKLGNHISGSKVLKPGAFEPRRGEAKSNLYSPHRHFAARIRLSRLRRGDERRRLRRDFRRLVARRPRRRLRVGLSLPGVKLVTWTLSLLSLSLSLSSLLSSLFSLLSSLFSLLSSLSLFSLPYWLSSICVLTAK
jgi:hypothetical protein